MAGVVDAPPGLGAAPPVDAPPGSAPVAVPPGLTTPSDTGFRPSFESEFKTHPRAKALYDSLSPYGLRASDVTSVVAGPHVKHSAHFDGRAIDVGSIGGQSIGPNPATLAFVEQAIVNGHLQKIGSDLSIINNPRLRALAQQHGVELFEDDVRTGATGTHLHLQVAGENAPVPEKRLPPGPPLRAGMAAAWEALNKPLGGPASAAEHQDPHAPVSAPPGLGLPGMTPPDHAPMPAGYTPATWAAAQKERAAKAGPPHSAIEQASGVVDVPGIFAGGLATGEVPQAMEMFIRNPAEANAHYGILAKPILERGAAAGNPTAKYLLAHPAQTAIAQGTLDMFNPVNDLVGGAMGKVGGTFVGVVSKTPAGRALLNAFSPFRGIAANGGQVAKRAVQAMMVRVASQPAAAQAASLRIFGGLSPQAMDDVIHVYQGSTKAVQTKDPAALNVIHDRAEALREYLAGITQGKLDQDLIAKETARDRPTHFPLESLFERNATGSVEEQAAQFDRELRGSGGGSTAPITREGTEHTEAVHHSLAEADHALENNPRLTAIFHRHPDWSPPVALEKFAARSQQGTILEQSFKQLPPTLRRDMTPEDFGVKNYMQHTAFETPEERLANARAQSGGAAPRPPLDGRGRAMRSFDDLPPRLQQQLIDSPVLRRSWLSQDFINYLDKNSTRLYREPSMYPTGTDAKSVALKTALQAWDGYNNTMRAAIVTNPLVHPLWNLTNNALGQGLPIHEVAGLAARSIFSTLGQGKTVDRIVNFFDKDWSSWVDDAARAGALAEMRQGGPSATRLLASRWQDLSITDKFAKAADGARAWNTRLTFGPHGEEAFATALYRHLIKSGKFEGKEGAEEAGGLVREALGNYANVDPRAWQSRLLFFYPWLKGNTAFWVRKFATNPRATLTPADMARTNNALVGDPSEQNPNTRARDYQFDAKGFGGPSTPGLNVLGHQLVQPGPIGGDPSQFYRYSPLLPQRILSDVEDVGSGDLTRAGRGIEKVVAGHLQPIPRAGVDAYATLHERAADPSQPANFHTVWDKDAPPEKQAQQVAAYVAEHALPIPLVGYQVGDIIRQGGLKSNEVAPLALGAVGGGYAHAETAGSSLDKQIKRARSRLNSAFIKAYKIGKRNPEKAAQLQRRAYEEYEKKVRHANDRASGVKAKPSGVVDAPPGL